VKFSEGLGPVVEAPIVAKPTVAKRKKPTGKKTKDVVADSDVDTPESVKLSFERAEEARLATVPQEEMILDYVKGTLKPEYDRGVRHFCVPLRHKGRMLSVNADRWMQVLGMAGVAFSELLFVKDDRTWRGRMPGADELPLVIA
jgi:hypothetical protein